MVVDSTQAQGSGSIAHLALEGANYDGLIEALNKNGVRYGENDVPVSGERQVFISGPDGLNVEMLFQLGEV